MQKYDAAFSVPKHWPWPQVGHDVAPASLYCLYGNRYDRYEWGKESSKPWGDAPDESGTLYDLAGGLNLPGGFDTGLDAAVCLNNNAGTVYLFKGIQCLELSVLKPTSNARATATSPQPITHVFPGLPVKENGSSSGWDHVDAALPCTDGTIWFFSGNECGLYDPDQAVLTTGPSPITSTWTTMDPAPAGPDHVTWAAPGLDPDGHNTLQDYGYLSDGTTRIPCTPTTHTLNLVTQPGDHTLTIPNDISQITIELWGPGGSGGGGGASGSLSAPAVGGDGGAGAYLRDTVAVSSGQQLTFHVGASGDHTRYPATNPILVAAGGGHGGGGSSGGSGGNGGAGSGYPASDNPRLRGGAPGGDGGGVSGSGRAGGTGGSGLTGGSGAFIYDGAIAGVGGSGWNANGGDGVTNDWVQSASGGGAGPGGGTGGKARDSNSASGGGVTGGICTRGEGGCAGGGPSGGASGWQDYGGGGGAGGSGWGGRGAGGGGGVNYGGGGGGSQGWSLLQDPSTTHYDGGNGTQPAFNPPAGTATGGQGGNGTHGADGAPGAIRITW